jgi:leucyl-tRNA synthetase
MAKYNPKTIEKKWQKYWADQDFYTSKDKEGTKENYMLLTEFPYPSGNLHIGHWYAFALPDIKARYLRMKGKNVLYPIGFDAFGLPAENAAIKHGVNPRDWTKRNITFMTKQLRSMGATFDWSRKVETIDPEYYKWTQWMFLKMYEKGLAYRAVTKVNWCPKDKTVLANEQVVNGRCDRCDSEVVQKDMTQWMFKITEFADALYDDIDNLDWPEMTKTAQKNWIGRSEGAKIKFYLKAVANQEDKKHFVEVFTTRPDTIFGATFLVVSPELAQKWIDIGWQAPEEVTEYIKKSLSKKELDRIAGDKDKTGVDSGMKAINPASNEEIPVWIADYVLGGYGTGAIMAVPAHDERDFEFAKKFNLPVKTVIEPITGEELSNEEFRKSIVAIVENPKTGKILSINWGEKMGGNLFIGGGADQGEGLEQSARREIKEETGYKNLKLISQSEKIHHHYVAHSKGVNRNIEAVGFYFHLIDEAQDETALEKDEKDKFTIDWLSKKEASEKVRDALHGYVLQKLVFEKIYSGDGILINSGSYDGLHSQEGKKKIVEDLKNKELGNFEKTYRLRDWILSRQRYWGVPIPMIHCADCGYSPVPEEDLPVKLPTLKNYMPSDDGRSPLARSAVWLKTKCPKCRKAAERETDTMDTFVDSSWYFMRYTDSKNENIFATKEQMKYWLPVPSYLGGAEHNTMHLLYSRFFTKALHSLGYVDFTEPYINRRNRGIVLGPDGQKMSKSKGNVVDPDKEVAQYGADTVRMFLAFMGPYLQGGPWDPKGIVGVHRFIHRAYKLAENYKKSLFSKENPEVNLALVHRAIKKIGFDIGDLEFNTGVSELMKLLNHLEDSRVDAYSIETFTKLLAPFAPHLAEEIWQKILKHEESIHLQLWPEYDPNLLEESVVKIAVQINGKVRDVIEIGKNLSEKEAKDFALANENIIRHLEGREVKKFIYIPGRIINIVV